jgi:trimeric autotransporter adhesin
MKTKFTLAICLLASSFTSMAQNQITTPTGQPLVIGNQGVKLSNLNSGSATQPTNGKVLSVDATGMIFLAPDAGGTPSQFTNNGANIFFNTGNVGLGTNNPLQRLDVNGSINIANGAALRINNAAFLSAPGTANTVLGELAAGSISTGAYNVFLGAYTGQQNTSASYNLFLGPYAGQKTTTGSNNFFGGVNAGKLNTTGQSNTFIGTGSGAKNTTGSLNTFIGPNAGASNTTASLNFFAGTSSGYENTTGVRNLFLGYDAGRNNISGNDNVYIGSSSKPSGPNLANLSNSVAIGSNSTVTISNAIILGSTTSNVKIGIGNTAPTARLHVKANGTDSTGVRFENLPNAAGLVYNLFVDSNGNLKKSSTSSNAREANSIENNWTITPQSHIINTNEGGVIIGEGFTKLPKGYKLYVSEGLLTEKVKVALKNTDEWSDFVFSPDYKLKTLENVESFINLNKHLPGVPSASEMVNNGNDLNKTDALLLQKIEELTIYLIELNKENQKLKNRIDQIEKKQ